MTRVLVVDDEAGIREAVAYSLEAEGLDVASAASGQEALEAITREPFDVVLLDIVLGDLSGVEVCRRMRATTDAPILMLTARDTETDIVLGFEAGADDYVTKPFSMRELVSRTRAILRRRELDRAAAPHAHVVGDIRLDLLRHEAFVDERPVKLTPTELRLLSLLAGEDRAFTRREILEHVWRTTFVPEERSCDVHVANLRRKIEDDPAAPTRILTVRGIGYRLAREEI